MAISSAVDASAVARVVGIKTEFVNLRGGAVVNLPQRIAVIGQGSTASTYSSTKKQVTRAIDVATEYGFGSPLHLAVQRLLPVNGDGVGTIPVTVYPLQDDGSGVAAVYQITPTGSPTEQGVFYVNVNNVRSEAVVLESGAAIADICTAFAAAVNAVLDLPVTAAATATDVDLTAKWKGASGNGIQISVEGPTDIGLTFAITEPTPGAVNPDVDAALVQIGDVWETLALNCLDIADTTTLDKYKSFGEGRWGALTKKPLVFFTGNVNTTVAGAIAVSDARPSDYQNAQLVAPGSDDLPFVVAARQLARIAVLANNNPPHDYGSQRATGLVPGLDGDQWNYAERDQAVKAGSSTIEVKDNEVALSDTVTFYHPEGDPTPAYRYVVDIVKLQNIIFNLNLIFASAEWDGAPLIPDDQPTANPTAKKPKMAKAAVASLLDSLGLNAIISDPETAKENTFADISTTNPKRLDVATTVQLSGNTNIISIDLNFGFFFGTAQPIA